ncbi:hypothetical protein EUTSA_v10005547mg, partial [Eutrema salsugineum]
MEPSAKAEGLQFKWGKKRRIGVVEKKDVQFYESFTYGGSQYCLYDCVSFGDATKLDPPEFFVGKIINMWELNDQRRVELLWFFTPFEISSYLEGVQDVLANELFLASGTGVGLTNVNQLDVRNPQPSDEEIKLADFLFHRTFDVGTFKILDKIDDKIAGVDVKFIFNRTSCEKKASDVQKLATNVQGNADSLKPNRRSTSGSFRQNESIVSDLSGHRKSDYGYKNEKSRLAEERCSKDSYFLDDIIQKKRRLDGSVAVPDNRTQELQKLSQDGRKDIRLIRKDVMEEKSRLAGERCSKDSYCLNDMPPKKRRLDDSVAVSDGRTKESQKISHDGRKDTRPIRKDATVEKSRLSGEKYRKDSYCLVDTPYKERRLDGSVAVSDRRTKELQKISHDGRKDIRPIRSPKDKVNRGELYSHKPSFTDKKQDLRIPRLAEGKEIKPATEKAFKKPSSDCKISKHTEERMVTDANFRRHYRIFEVTQKPNVEESKWYRNLPWEENLRCAEGQGTLVFLRNLDPTYTSNEVEDIVYSALNEQCTARMIERTSVTIPHIGEALAIFNTMDAAKRVIRRLDEGCLLLSNGRTLVASNAKVNPPAMPLLGFTGHINTRTQMRRGKRNAVVTSHSSQSNTIEFDMAMDWCLHRDRYELTWKMLLE